MNGRRRSSKDGERALDAAQEGAYRHVHASDIVISRWPLLGTTSSMDVMVAGRCGYFLPPLALFLRRRLQDMRFSERPAAAPHFPPRDSLFLRTSTKGTASGGEGG